MSNITIQNLSLIFPHKICFEDFSTIIYPGSRIAIIGDNGAGKSSLLKILADIIEPTSGRIINPYNIVYVPQDHEGNLSGGESFNKALTNALSQDPDIILFDEPTNHLDIKNRNSLIRVINNSLATIIAATHDTKLIKECFDQIWHLRDGKIEIFTGLLEYYFSHVNIEHGKIESEIDLLEREKKAAHSKLMKEQERAKKSRLQGERKIASGKWPPIVAKAKELQGQATTGKKKNDINNNKQDLVDRLSNLRLPELIQPKFSIDAKDIIANKVVVNIKDGKIGYEHPILENINLSITSKERVAFLGNNGSGKSTLIKAIIGENILGGEFYSIKEWAYLDQNYNNLN